MRNQATLRLTHTHEAIMLAHPATVTSTTLAARPLRALHRTLWVVQLLLAAVFLLVGYTHAAAPIEVAVQRAPWVASLPVALVRFIGVVELAGALGILLPAATRIVPMLTPLAAVGLAAIMALAIPFHLLRGETSAVLLNLGLGSLAALVAVGRTRWAPITANR
jgi:uncharacterized membrane protein